MMRILRYFPAAILFMLIASPAFAQPRLVVSEGTHFSLGDIYRGSVVNHDMTLVNAGKDTLVIDRIEASCGCTGTVVSANRIPPGGTGTLRITFNSKNFTGPIHKTVSIASNASDQTRTLIEFEGNVIDEIVISPEQFWFQDAQVGKKTSMTLSVKNGGKEPLALKGFRSSLKGLTVVVPKKPIPPGGSADLTAEFTPETAVPVLTDWVFINTSSPRRAEVSLPIYGNVKPANAK